MFNSYRGSFRNSSRLLFTLLLSLVFCSTALAEKSPQAIVFLVDKSRSMSEGKKLDTVKQSLIKVFADLSPKDEVAIIGFDSNPFLVLRMQSVAQSSSLIEKRVNTLLPVGRTNLLPSLDLALRELQRSNNKPKRLFLITDGKVSSRDAVMMMVDKITKEGITLSVLCIGLESDLAFLREIAIKGKGSFYQVANSSGIPKAFKSELSQ